MSKGAKILIISSSVLVTTGIIAYLIIKKNKKTANQAENNANAPVTKNTTLTSGSTPSSPFFLTKSK